MKVYVTDINVPGMSTVGFGRGTTEDGTEVAFVGDHRPMRTLGEALIDAEEPVEAQVDDSQLLPVQAYGAITGRSNR
jgi:hypothetical protein